MKVFIAVTHLLGAGHLTRAAALGRAFSRAGHEVTLLSGGFPSPLVDTAGITLVQLPPVRSDGTDFRKLLDEQGDPVSPAFLDGRRDAGVHALRQAQPDVVVTELFPFGRRALAQEFDALVTACQALAPRPLVVCSVRDILVAPTKPERVREAHGRLGASYDGVLVHGDPDLVRLEVSWPLDDAVRRLVHYTGYVDDGACPLEAPGREARSEILVSGGSSRASLRLYEAAVRAARLMPERPWRVLVGHGIDEQDFGALSRDAGANLRVERARPDFRALLARAAVSVSQAGYNTTVDLLSAKTPAVLVPFEAGRETEQRLRAERLGRVGLAWVLTEARLSPENLAAAVASQLARPPADARRPIDMDGARRSVGLVEKWFAGGRGSAGPRPAMVWQGADWSALDAALRRAMDRGCPVWFWWRDDDAVAATPALERLLALRARYGAPLAIAAIPALVDRSLPQRLASETLTTVLVHGLAHRNHAPAGEKKAEFGPHRPVPERARDARQALTLARAAFGSALRPIFVPPWNRLAPDLAPALSEIGFVAVSSYADGQQPPRGPLTRLDTHIDPIDWRGRRGLADPSRLIARVAAAVHARAEAPSGEGERIGLLTHHLVQDAATWDFCEALLERIALAPPAVIVGTDDLLARKASRPPESAEPAIVKSGGGRYTG